MLGDAGGISHGIGYTLPFQLVGAPGFNAFTFPMNSTRPKFPRLFPARFLSSVLWRDEGRALPGRAGLLHQSRRR